MCSEGFSRPYFFFALVFVYSKHRMLVILFGPGYAKACSKHLAHEGHTNWGTVWLHLWICVDAGCFNMFQPLDDHLG